MAAHRSARASSSGKGSRNWSGPGDLAQLRGTEKSLPVDARNRNRQLVLRLLFHHDLLSRAELMHASGLTVGSASAIVRELVDEGLVIELDPKRGPGAGKPRTPLSLRADAFNIVGIDLSDPDDIRAALVDLRGERLARRSASIGDDQPLETMTQIAHELIAEAKSPVLGVGVSSPGIISPTGTVIRSTTYGWANYPLVPLLGERVGVPTIVANDANAAALAEFTFGGATGDGMMTITVGRGVGAGLMLGGVLAQGADHSVGEIGHITAVNGGLVCTCGRRGCLETIFSAPLLRRMVADYSGPELERQLKGIGRKVGTLLSPLVGALSLKDIRVSAPEGLLLPPLLESMEQTLRQRALPMTDPVVVQPARLNAKAQLLGAAALVLSAELGIA